MIEIKDFTEDGLSHEDKHAIFQSAYVTYKNLFGTEPEVKIKVFDSPQEDNACARYLHSSGTVKIYIKKCKEIYPFFEDRGALIYNTAHEITHKYQKEGLGLNIQNRMNVSEKAYAKCKFEHSANKTATKILKTMMPEICGYFCQNNKRYNLRPSKYKNFHIPAKTLFDAELATLEWK